MTTHSAPTMRVLTRPRADPTPPLPPIPSSSSTAALTDSRSPSQGVVVVAFISRRPDYSTHLINRVLDFPAFGYGNLDQIFQIDKDELRDWFKFRRISYYHDVEKGIVYLQFCSTNCPVVHGFSGAATGFDSPVEEQEFGDLQGMLFLFSVCHIIVYIMEGSRFETQTLKNFRLLQSAKNALAPFVRSQTLPMSSSRPPTSSARSIAAITSPSISPGRSRISGRGSSGISPMSGLGSYASLFPGQCTPVILFIFIDDYLNSMNSASTSEDVVESSSSLDTSANLTGLPRSSLTTKGSGSVVMLARPVNKSEGSFKKKLQSSLETQIRHLIKRCRTLSGSENGQSGSRSAGSSSSAPLFTLDTSRIAILLDRVTIRGGESLEFATGLVEDVLNGKATSDSLLLESYHGQNANKEDTISIREFIHRQCDVLRGRGGLMGGPSTGGGMVAVAAAAAAASVASGKLLSAPELPTLDLWRSMSEVVLQGILIGRRGIRTDNEINRRKPRQRNASPPLNEGLATSKGVEPPDIAVSWLERGKGLNVKFSTSWCQKMLPMAKEVYLKDLPPCYPTSQHEAHLEKALHAFSSMVKGPSVPYFAKVLEDQCESIWKSGRQQCDAVSFTGKPCMHQKHDAEEAGSEHASGYVFLHACACGRSRSLRDDPFDFESANVTNCFLDCDKLLPALELPEIKSTGPIKPSSWSLLRVGSSKYYEPSKGLMQSGFSSTQKFLLRWPIFLEKNKKAGQLSVQANEQDSLVRSGTHPTAELNAPAVILKSRDSTSRIENSGARDNVFSDEKKISFGRLAPNFTMKKPFSEVVAGSAAADSAFPPLHQRKPPVLVSENGNKKSSPVDRAEPSKLRNISSNQEPSSRNASNGLQTNDPFPKLGSNVVSIDVIPGENTKLNTSPKQAVAYVGFEHECPHGHRFLLNTNHLNELGSLYSSCNEFNESMSDSTLDASQTGPLRSGANGTRDKALSGTNSASFSKKKIRNTNKSRGQISRQSKEDPRASDSVAGPSSELVEEVSESLACLNLDNNASAFSMLNRNLPIYMDCPYCKLSKDNVKAKFAGTVSQLQRIFMVTPAFPVVLATSPVIRFEASSLPSDVPSSDQRLKFSLGGPVVLPPESFLVLRLPFIYGVQLEDQTVHPLRASELKPDQTAWMEKGTAFFLTSKENGLDDG